MAHIESNFAPRDQFVNEAFGRLTHSPPARGTAVWFLCDVAWIPILSADHAVEDLVRGNVAEVEIGRESRGDIALWLISLAVVLQFVGNERLESLCGCDRASRENCGYRYALIDR